MDLLSYISINKILKAMNKHGKSIFPFTESDIPLVVCALRSIETLLHDKGVDVEIKKYVVNVSSTKSYMFFSIKNKNLPSMIEYYIPSKGLDIITLFGVPSEFIRRGSINESNSNLIKESEDISKDIQEKANILSKLFKESFGDNLEQNDESSIGDVAVFGSDMKFDILDKQDAETLDAIDIGLVPLMRFLKTSVEEPDKVSGVVEITDDSSFSVVESDTDANYYNSIFEPNSVYTNLIKNNFIFQISRERYLSSFNFLVRGRGLEDSNENMTHLLNETKDDVFLVEVVDDEPTTLLYDIGEDKIVKGSFKSVSATSPIVCMPIHEENELEKSTFSISVIDMEEEIVDNVILVGESLLSIKDVRQMYSEASAKQMATKLIRKLKSLPSDVYDKYLEIVSSIKRTLSNYKKAKDDKLREEILNDEYLPELRKLIAFVKGLAVGSLLVLTGIASPFIALVGGWIVYILSRISDEKRRKKAVRDIRNEIEILSEKIDDAKADGNKQAKYELKRIQFELLDKIDVYRTSKTS